MKLRLKHEHLRTRNGDEVRVYRSMPEGWKRVENAVTAPIGYQWISNNRSRFSDRYRHGLLKEA